MEKSLRKTLKGGQFRNVPPLRSKTMKAIKGKGNLTTERKFRMLLVRAAIRGWQLHPQGLHGRPDIFFPQNKVAIFIDGCFWHGCQKCGHFPKTNEAFWRAKIERNRKRDTMTSQILKRQGYKVIRFWEHQLRENSTDCLDRLRCILV